MRKVALLMLASVLGISTYAQDASMRDVQAAANRTVKNEGGATKGLWTKGGQFAINVNQGGYDNWIPAGDADWSVGGNGYLNLFANRAWAGKLAGKAKNWTNNLDINQGILSVHDERTDATTFNKLDDRLDFLSKYSIEITKKLSFATVANLRTQLYRTEVGGKLKSNFMAPGYITLAPGIQWNPNTHFSLLVAPISARWVTLTNEPNRISIDNNDAKPFGVNPRRKVDFQPGYFAQALLNTPLGKDKKINLRSRLDLYGNWANHAERVDIFFDNYLSMPITKWISAGINLTMVYDHDIQKFGWNRNVPALQYFHNIGIGLSKKLRF
jgi:hypothetical protein